MRLPRMTIRQLMIAVAILAPLMAASAMLIGLCTSLQDFYGTGGKLDLQQQIGNELAGGDYELRQARFVEAEAHYRSALRLYGLLQSKLAYHGWTDMFDCTVEGQLGIADALTGQGRFAEAEPLYRRSLSAREEGFGRNHFVIAEVLERYATFLRATRRVPEAKALEARALRILDDYVETARQDERNTFWKEVEARARAIRSRPAQ